MWSILFAVVSLCVGQAHGYSGGPPSNVCNSMTPSPYAHGNPQTGSNPYTVTLDKTTYSPGDTVSVTLQGGSFIGFFIQPRPSRDEYRTLGSFDSPALARNPCSSEGNEKNVALSHSSKVSKNQMVITWTAPSNYQGDIVFVYTVVQTKQIFWVKQVSSTLRYQAPTGPTQNPPETTTKQQTTVTTQTQTTQPTSQAATTGPTQNSTETTTKQQTTSTTQTQTTRPISQATINKDSACGVSKGCFPADCQTDCDYLVTWKDVGNDIEFSLQKKTTQQNYWIAIAFSTDPKMGNDSVADCIANQGVVDVLSSYNHIDKYNVAFNNGNYGVTMTSGSLTNGVLSCQFLRKKTSALASGSLGRKKRQLDAGEANFFDLNDDWYLLVAHGTAANGVKNFHTTRPAISPMPIDFQSVTVPEVNTPSSNTGGKITKDQKCGDTVGCFHDCEGDNCNFLLTWLDNGDKVDISLSCKIAGNSYCAIGMSDDKKMGEDSVFECVSNGGIAQAYVSYNLPGNDNQRLSNNVFGLTSISSSHVDGVLQCVFSRQKTAALAQSLSGRKKREVTADASTYFDMNSNWFLLYAYGSSIGGFLNKHSVLPQVSSKEADFQSTDDIGATGIENMPIRVHGILMVVAWMLNATLGIFMARFYKTVWPEGTEVCGDKRWFVIHRIMMISTFCLTAAGIVVIFVHVEGWAEIVGTGFQKSHPIIGVVVAGLALINPIMAALRPHPGTPRRPLFKAGHTLVGVAAYVCAIVNVFSGTMLPAAHIPEYIRYILYVFCGWTFLIEMILHIYDCTKSSGKRGEAYEMKSSGDRSGGNKGEVDTVKVGFMVLHWIVVIGLAVAVCIILAVGEKHDH